MIGRIFEVETGLVISLSMAINVEKIGHEGIERIR
jgi:hypothetical protein